MARVKTMTARIAQGTCGKCGDPINPGDTYRSTKNYRSPKKVRCAKPGCMFRPSDLTTSKMGPALDAQQDASNTIAEAGSHEDMSPAFDDLATALRDVAEEYRDASSQWAGGNGHPEWDEKADGCDAAADEAEEAGGNLESLWEDCLAESEGDEEDALEALREQADEALSIVEMPY